MRVGNVKYIVIFALTLMMVACGNSDVSAPPGSTITISPAGLKVEDGRTQVYYDQQLFTVTVHDAEGRPIRDAEITIFYLWAEPNPSAVVQLYDSNNNPVDSPFTAHTDEFGTYTFYFGFNSGGGLSYKADLEVRSGEIFASQTIEISAP